MSTPHEEQPRPPEVPAPSVTTAPDRARWSAGWLPARLGRARTSTVVLAVLWVGIYVLWTFVAPDTTGTTSTGTAGTQVETPARRSTEGARTTAPEETTTPAPGSSRATNPSDASSTASRTPTPASATTTAPSGASRSPAGAGTPPAAPTPGDTTPAATSAPATSAGPTG